LTTFSFLLCPGNLIPPILNIAFKLQGCYKNLIIIIFIIIRVEDLVKLHFPSQIGFWDISSIKFGDYNLPPHLISSRSVVTNRLSSLALPWSKVMLLFIIIPLRGVLPKIPSSLASSWSKNMLLFIIMRRMVLIIMSPSPSLHPFQYHAQIFIRLLVCFKLLLSVLLHLSNL